MAELSVEQVKALLDARGISGIAEDELVETTQRVNALMRGIERLEESVSFGDVGVSRLFDPQRPEP